MNDAFIEKCRTPSFFSSVKYAVHTIDDDRKMAEIVLEICNINPYLGVDIYITSEENDELRKQIEECLHQISEDNIITKIQLSLAWYLLGNDIESLSICKNVFSVACLKSRKKGNCSNGTGIIDAYWKNLLYEMVLNEKFIDVWPDVLNLFYLDYGNFDITDNDRMRKMLEDTYVSKDYGRFLVALDAAGLYGTLDSIVHDFRTFYIRMFDKYINGKLRYAINYKQNANPFSKLTALYLIRGNDASELLSTLRNTKYKQKIFVGREPLYFFINHYATNNYKSRYEVCISETLKKMWSSDLNGIPYPIKGFTSDGDEPWWRGRCGHVWRRTINLMEKSSSCPFCEKGALSNE